MTDNFIVKQNNMSTVTDNLIVKQNNRITVTHNIVSICGLSDEGCYVVKSRCLLWDARRVVYTLHKKYLFSMLCYNIVTICGLSVEDYYVVKSQCL